MENIFLIIRRLTFALIIMPIIIPAVQFGSGDSEVDLNADNFEMIKGGAVKAIGNVVLKYQGAQLYADEITFDIKSKIVQSPGWTRVVYQNYELNGQKVIYNLSNQAGQFENAHAVIDFGAFQFEGHWYERKWYAYGKKITKDPNAGVFHVNNGKVTTCPPEYQKPLYYFEAKKLTIIIPNGKDPESKPRITARNCFLKFEGVPILWLPHLTYTMREDDSQSPVQINAGYDSEKGAVVEGAIDIFRSENLRVTPHVGFYSKHGVSFGVDGSYYSQYTNITKFSGDWKTFFINDLSRNFIQEKQEDKKDNKMFRYRFLWEHSQEFGPGAGWLKGGLLTWQVDWLSDVDLPMEFYRDDYERNGQRDTYIDFTKPIGQDNEVSVYLVKQINDFYTTYERLPEFRHVFKKRRILTIPALNVPVYYQSKSRAGFYHYIEDENLDDKSDYSIWRAWTDHKLSAPKRYFGFLNVEPFVGLAASAGWVSQYNKGESYTTNSNGKLSTYTQRETPIFWMSDFNRYTRTPINVFNKNKKGGFFHVFPYSGVNVNFKMNRTYDLEGSYMGELMRRYLSSDNEKIRHIIEPKFRALGMGGYGTDSGVAFGIDAGIRNAFQIKRRGRNVDLLDVTVFQSIRGSSGELFKDPVYSKTYTKKNGTFYESDKERYYTPQYALGIDFNASPTDWLALEGDFIWDMDKYNRITRADFISHSDVSWFVQRFFSSPWMLKSLRGRKDEMILDLGYHYLYDYSNLITLGSRIWFDDFTPMLSEKYQQKPWARELSRGWGLGFDLRYEAMSGNLQEMEYTLYKNWKKCLDTSLTYRLRDGDQAIMATFWLTAYPKTKLGLGN